MSHPILTCSQDSLKMPSTPVTPKAVSMLCVIRKGTCSGTLKLFPVRIMRYLNVYGNEVCCESFSSGQALTLLKTDIVVNVYHLACRHINQHIVKMTISQSNDVSHH